MGELNLQIEALAPLAFPERKPGIQFNASLPYIPGAAIYGAIGQQLGPDGFDAALFRALRCCNAYPARAGDPWVRPLPATAITPKNASPETPPDDALYARVAWETQQPSALIYAPTDEDGRPWEAAGSGFYTLSAAGALARREAQQRVLTRVAINRTRGTAQDGRLYSPLVLSEVDRKAGAPSVFFGSVVVPDGAEDEVTVALEGVTHLGARQTTGLGAVQIAPRRESAPADEPATILRRVRAMTARFQAQAALYEALGGAAWSIADASIFTVNLLADALLLEQGWLPTQELDPALLADAAGTEVRLLRSFTATKPVGGFHSLWQRPKQAEIAVLMGGLYVFQAARALDEAACAGLARLQRDGVGDRRAEGFGQIRICDEFHVPGWREQP